MNFARDRMKAPSMSTSDRTSGGDLEGLSELRRLRVNEGPLVIEIERAWSCRYKGDNSVRDRTIGRGLGCDDYGVTGSRRCSWSVLSTNLWTRWRRRRIGNRVEDLASDRGEGSPRPHQRRCAGPTGGDTRVGRTRIRSSC